MTDLQNVVTLNPTTGSAMALEVDDLDGGYGQTTILRGITLRIAPGEVVALLGPNGAGKTTFLNTVSGLLRPSRGRIVLHGTDVTAQPPNRRVRLGLCHVPEGRGVYRNLSVRDNLVMQSKRGGETDAIARAAEAFPILGQRLTQTAGNLSGGQQQMLAMAAAYVRDPSLILVDEASLGLAPVIVDEIFDFLGGLARGGAALLVVDQYVARALALAQRAYVMSRGSIVFEGAASDLSSSDIFERYLSGASPTAES